MDVLLERHRARGHELTRPVLVLHLEDNPLDADLARLRLIKAGIPAEIDRVHTREDFTHCLGEKKYDLILSDYNLPQFDGLSALQIAQEVQPETPFIFLTGALGEEVAIDMLKKGATDYVLKQRIDRLGPAIQRALAEARERTRRLEVEAALRRSEAQYWAAIDSVQEYAIVAIGDDQRIKTWNRGAAMMRGYSAAEAIGMPFAALFTPEDQASGSPNLELQTASRNGELRGERVCIRKDGTRFKAKFVLTATYGKDQELAGWLEVTHDITAQKEAEAEREALLARETIARAEAESASRVKDEFLAVASHELRTPLNAILGWASLLQGSSDPRDLKEGLKTIYRNAKHQAQLIEDILDVSRMVTGRLRLNPGMHDLAPIINQSLATIRTAADAKGVTIRQRLGEIGRISCDADRLEQVVWNLVSNAIKFSNRGSEVLVQLSRTDSHAVLTVADNGAGIAPHFLPYVFQRFRQADGSTTRRHGGLGLGLAIVRHLVELHGGTVRAASDGEGLGATFTVELPLPDSPPVEEPDAARDHAPGGCDVPVAEPLRLPGTRVLVVDDDADARRFLQGALERCGAQVSLAASAAEAITHLLSKTPPEVLVSDIGMPETDGFSLIQQVRQREAHIHCPRMPAVALTAYTRPEDRASAAAAGFDVFLAKPIEPQDLVSTLLNLLANRA